MFSSCGIEDYAYLQPVPSGDIRITLNNMATVPLPDQGIGSNFTHYTLYYRIYISDIPESGEIQRSRAAMDRINPALSTDYFYLEPYTNTNNNVNTSTATLLRNRNYQVLSYIQAGSELNDVVKNGPGDLELHFPVLTGSIPYLVYGGTAYNLYRSNGSGAFSPRPDRYFRNSSEINSGGNVSSTINADVVNKSNASGPRYTYAALYIAATGLSQPAYTPFYSIPTFIGVFRLPEQN
ncbi:MAG: hypothetical protein LBH26_08915 [Treponema sp.]|nr:hypothetical protein [Treponema sp.]